MKTVTIDLGKLSDVLSKEVVRKIVYNKLNRKVNNWQKKIPDAYTLIQSNQCSKGKENFEQKMGMLRITYQILAVYRLLLFLIQTLEKLRIRFLMLLVWSRKHSMTLAYQTLRKNTLLVLVLIITNLRVTYLILR